MIKQWLSLLIDHGIRINGFVVVLRKMTLFPEYHINGSFFRSLLHLLQMPFNVANDVKIQLIYCALYLITRRSPIRYISHACRTWNPTSPDMGKIQPPPSLGKKLYQVFLNLYFHPKNFPQIYELVVIEHQTRSNIRKFYWFP